MIDRTEIIRLAGELGLAPRVVEKDYVLGWVLAGIARDDELSRAWLFKGGTCLKKCFFETYRFSEDLDFTITEPVQLDRDFLIARFKILGAWLYNATGIELPPEQLRFDVYHLKTGGRAGEGRLAYRGPIAPRGGDLPRIKLDLTADERVVLPSVIAPATHPYTDAPADGITARCYAFEELFGEKVRALAQGARPRDLYDVINLFRHGDFRDAAMAIRHIVIEKCDFKKISVSDLRESSAGTPGARQRMGQHARPPVALPAAGRSVLGRVAGILPLAERCRRAAAFAVNPGRGQRHCVAWTRRRHPHSRPQHTLHRGDPLRGIQPSARRTHLPRRTGQPAHAADRALFAAPDAGRQHPPLRGERGTAATAYLPD
jgi:predicted nucleotidyltransferase component of viral defense system